MLPEERNAFLKKNAQLARQYRKTLPYQMYLKQRKLYAKSRKISELRCICKKKNMKYDLDDNYVQTLIESNCYFCNREINKTTYDMSFICRNNIDRGYVKNNVIPVCPNCCIMKSSSLKLDFIHKILYISDNLNIINLPSIRKNKYKALFMFTYNKYSISENIYKSKAKKRGIDYQLSSLEFDFLTNKQCCYYCNIYHDKIGIDRINSFNSDNDKKSPYKKDNCVPCCKICNYIKREIDYDEFIQQCKNISIHTLNKLKAKKKN